MELWSSFSRETATNTLRHSRCVYAVGSRAGVALCLPQRSQEVVQGSAVPLVADSGEEAGLDRPDVGEAKVHIAQTDALELGAGAVVYALTFNGGSAYKNSRRGKERQDGLREEHAWRS